MRAILAAMTALPLMTACGAKEEAAEAPRAAPIPYEGPQTTAPGSTTEGRHPDYVWGYAKDGGAHLLALGAPNSDRVIAVFRCEAAAPGVNFAFFQHAVPPITVKVAGGQASAVWAVRPTEDKEVHAWVLAGEVPDSDPVFATFLKDGQLKRWYGDRADGWEAKTAAEREAIGKFAIGCKDKL